MAQEEYGLQYTGLERHYVECQCSDFNHVFRFVLDERDGDLWLEVQLNLWRPWYKRLWSAIRFVFGRPEAYGHFDTTHLREEDYVKLHALLDRSALIKRKTTLGSPQKKPVLKG